MDLKTTLRKNPYYDGVKCILLLIATPLAKELVRQILSDGKSVLLVVPEGILHLNSIQVDNLAEVGRPLSLFNLQFLWQHIGIIAQHGLDERHRQDLTTILEGIGIVISEIVILPQVANGVFINFEPPLAKLAIESQSLPASTWSSFPHYDLISPTPPIG